MYIKVFYGGFLEDDKREPSYILVNPNCPMRMIYDYIRKTLKIKDDLEYDLYDEEGSLIFICDKDPWTNGSEYFSTKKDYFVITFERDEDNRPMNPIFNIPEHLMKSQGNELLSKINKQLNPAKPSRNLKTN